MDIIPHLNAYISLVNPSYIIIISVVVMVYFAIADYRSYANGNHIDYKSIIVSMGVLGTFVGILIGLADFNTSDIKGSIPTLLNGLKTAFVTSVVGMFLSVLLSAFQKNKGRGEAEDELSALKSINDKLDALTSIDVRLKNLESLSDVMPLVNTKLDSINVNFKELSKDVSSVKEHMSQSQNQLFEFLQENLEKIRISLEEAVDKLAEGATKEIIDALNNVIKDFNNNLTEQFGDNFKQLNESVKNMITWQENYKNSIETLEASLKQSVEQFKATTSEIEKTAAHMGEIAKNNSEIRDTNKELKEIITINQNQIQNLESHLKTLEAVGIRAGAMMDNIDKFSETMQGSISNQSKALEELTNDLKKQLPESLGELNKSLTSLTNKFRSDYEAYLKMMSEVTGSLSSR